MITQEEYDANKELVKSVFTGTFPFLTEESAEGLFNAIALIASTVVRVSIQAMTDSDNKINP